MKNITNILYILLGSFLFTACSSDDNDGTQVNFNRTPVEFAVSPTTSPSCENNSAVFDLTAQGSGILYYTVLPSSSSEAPTAANLVNGYAPSGSGIAGAVVGGRLVNPNQEVVTIPNIPPSAYHVIYAVMANEEGYLGDVSSTRFGYDADVNISSNYNSYAYSSDLGQTMDNAVAGNTDLTPVAGTDNQYFVRSLWGDNFVATLTGNDSYQGQYIYPAILKINEDNTVNVLNTGNEADAYAQGGSGTYDPCTNRFNLVIQQGLFSNQFTVNVLLKVD